MALDQDALSELVSGLGALTEDAILITEGGVWDDPPSDSTIVWCNARFEAMTGYSADEVIGRSPEFLRGPGTNRETVRRVLAERNADMPVRAELLNYRKNGEPFWVDITVKPLCVGPAATPLRLSVQRDITEAKQREEALRAALEDASLLGAVVESVKHEIQIFDAETLRYERANGVAQRNLGYDCAALRALTPPDVMRDVDAARLRAIVARLSSGAEDKVALRTRQIRRDGRTYPCLVELTYFERAAQGLVVAVVTDLTERKAQRDQIERSERRFRMAVEASADGIWEWDLVSGAVAFSARNREMLGYSLEEFPDRYASWLDVLHPDDRDRVTAEISRYLRDRDRYEITYRVRRKDGGYLWWRSRAALERAPDGRLLRITGANSDVTALVEARRAAEEAARLKAGFLAKMSHEIRTPLNGILGMAELMRFTESDAEKLSRLQTITSSGRSLLSIIEDVLTMARLEVGAEPARESVFGLDALCEEAFDAVRATALRKGLALEHGCAQGLYRGDARRIRQVLINLVGNAVKYTDAGAVRISAAPSGPDRLRFEVADTGPGVPEAMREAIFEPFRQLDDSATRAHGGLGLGLAVAREFVTGLGGAIGMIPRGGEGGSVFWFVVPGAASAAD